MRTKIIGKIITISDDGGQLIVDGSADIWEKHGYVVESLDFQSVMKIRNWSEYF